MAASRVRRIALWASLFVVTIAVIWVGTNFVLVTNAASQAQGRTATADAVVILGAAQYNGEPSPVLERRLQTAFELWVDDAADRIVTTGANQPGDVFTEGFAGFRYLRNAGVEESEIIVVVDGGDTYESLLATRNQLSPGEREVIIVTDAYHALRSHDIASEVGLDATVVAAGDDTGLSRRLRETVGVSIGRLVSYRRLSAWR